MTVLAPVRGRNHDPLPNPHRPPPGEAVKEEVMDPKKPDYREKAASILKRIHEEKRWTEDCTMMDAIDYHKFNHLTEATV